MYANMLIINKTNKANQNILNSVMLKKENNENDLQTRKTS